MHAILTKVRENCELRNLAENTQFGYSRHIRQFFEFLPITWGIVSQFL